MERDNFTVDSKIREKAERMFRRIKESGNDEKIDESKSLVEELQIHQIELEIQNDELIHAREELESSRDQYLSLFHDSPLSYVVLDENGIITRANDTFIKVVANNGEVVRNAPLSSFISEESKAIFLGKYRSFFKKGGEFDSVIAFNTNGTSRYFKIVGRQRDGNDGKPQLLLAMTDVTATVKYQKKLIETNRELEKFTYRVSHDLNNQARQMRSFCKLLASAEKEELDELKNYIINLSDEINNVVDGLLNLSRSTSYEINRTNLNANIIGRDVLRMLAREYPDRKVDVKIDDDLEVFADSNLFKILLTNLLSNAWKFTKYIDDAEIEVGFTETPKGRALFVRDNGVGIEKKFQNQVFDTFTRFHSPDKFEGSGIGLATVKRIVERHGGSIWLESEPGSGTTFYIIL